MLNKKIFSEKIEPQSRCVYCHSILQIVWVHGHGQCAVCKTNVDECCRGEQSSTNETGENKSTIKLSW